jgi:aldehyde:ferredoxin oxidoreductase
MAGIFRVNMSDLSVRREEPIEAYRDLGGRALTSAIVADEVPPNCHPLSADNRLVFAPWVADGNRGTLFGPFVRRSQKPADTNDQRSQFRRNGRDPSEHVRHPRRS